MREQLFRKSVSIASEGEHDNVPLITRTLELRHELAGLLGYKSYADKSLATKMAQDTDEVHNLLQALQSRSSPVADKERTMIEEFARGQGHNGSLELWDMAYWTQRYMEANLHLNENETRLYFPMETVLKGLFGICEKLFGVTVSKPDDQPQIWHEDVALYTVHDTKSGQHIASFYLDPYIRAHEKSGGAWMGTCRSKTSSGLPIAYLVCNFTPPLSDTPSCLTFDEVRTLFHEVGFGVFLFLLVNSLAMGYSICLRKWSTKTSAESLVLNGMPLKCPANFLRTFAMTLTPCQVSVATFTRVNEFLLKLHKNFEMHGCSCLEQRPVARCTSPAWTWPFTKGQ